MYDPDAVGTSNRSTWRPKRSIWLWLSCVIVCLVLLSARTLVQSANRNVAFIRLTKTLAPAFRSSLESFPIMLATDLKNVDSVDWSVNELPIEECWARRGSGLFYLARGEVSDAIQSLRDAMGLCGSNEFVIWDLGRAYWMAGEKVLALDAWRKVGASRYFYGLGHALIQQGSTQLGIDLLTVAIDVKPDSEAYYIELAQTYDKTGRSDMGIEVMQRALDVLPGTAQLHSILGDLYISSKQRCLSCAIDQYELALKSSLIVDPEIALRLARSLLWQQDYTRTLAVLDRLSQSGFRSYQVHDLYAEIYLYMNRLDDAELHATTSAQMSPESSWVWYLLGLIEYRLDKRNEAKMALERLTQIDPQLATALKQHINVNAITDSPNR
jgi:tetratricopeptide (TPR) repeat protein